MTATEESLIECAKGLIESHLYFASGALKTDEEIEIIIYVIGLDERTMKRMKKSEESEKMVLPRYRSNGEQHDRDYHCYTYDGKYYGITAPMQSLRITGTMVELESEMELLQHWTKIEGIWYKCLTLAKKVKEDMGASRLVYKEQKKYWEFGNIEIMPVNQEAVGLSKEIL